MPCDEQWQIAPFSLQSLSPPGKRAVKRECYRGILTVHSFCRQPHRPIRSTRSSKPLACTTSNRSGPPSLPRYEITEFKATTCRVFEALFPVGHLRPTGLSALMPRLHSLTSRLLYEMNACTKAENTMLLSAAIFKITIKHKPRKQFVPIFHAFPIRNQNTDNNLPHWGLNYRHWKARMSKTCS